MFTDISGAHPKLQVSKLFQVMCMDLALNKSETHTEDLMHFWKFYFCFKTLMFSKEKKHA